MKKFLLSLATLALAASTAMADQLTVTWADENIGNGIDVPTTTKAPVTFSFSKGSNNNTPKYYNTGNGIRLYGGNTMTISVAEGYELTSVVLNTSTGSNAINSGTTVTNGTITIDGGTTTLTANANVSSMTMTEGGTSGHARIQSIVVNYTAVAGDKELAGLQFPESSYTAILGQAFTAPTLTKATNAAVSYTSSNPEVAAVNATTGEVTLVAAGTTTIKAEAPENDTYTAGSAQYTLTVVKGYNTLAEYLAACGNKNDEGYINCPLTVTFTNGANTYVIDDAGTAALIFKYDLGYEVGNIIPAGWAAKTDVYYGLVELVPVGTMPASTENSGVTYNEVTSIDDTMMNQIVVLKNVNFAAETPATAASFTGTVGETEYTFYNKFTIASTAAGIYDVKVAVSTRNGLQLYPIEYQQAVSEVPVISASDLNEDNEFASTSTVTITAAEGATIYYRTNTEADFQVYNAAFTINATTSIYAYAVEEGKQQSREVSVTYYYNPSLGIDGIEVENGAAQYYNMQGVRVANPENGMYIRVQNGKAQKVIIK